MEDLATSSDFAARRRPIANAATIVTFTFRILVFLAIALLLGIDWSTVGTAFWRSVFLAVAVGVILGLIAAIPAYFVERQRESSTLPRKVSEILTTGADLLPPAPPNARARLLCAAALPKRQFVGGMLYVSPIGLTFQPHYGPRSWRRSTPRPIPESLLIGPPTAIVISTGYFSSARSRLARFLGVPPDQALIVEWPGMSAAFTVPDAALVAGRLQTHLDALRPGIAAV